MKRPILCLALLAIAVPAAAYDLPDVLRARVEALVTEAATPTTRENAVERMAILWEWANVVSLQGGFIPKNLPLAAHYVPHPTPGTVVTQRYLEAIDLYVRHLAMLDRDPEALGSIAVEPAEPLMAGSWQTIRIHWTVGSIGVAEGGGILVSPQMMGGYTRPQVEDPSADGLVSIQSSNPEVSFDLDSASVWGPYGGFRAPVDFPVFRVRGAALRSGDEVILVYGDRSGGGRGLRVGTFSNTAIALPLHLDPGDGSFYELPLPTFEVVGAEAERVHGFAPSIVPTGKPFTISLRTEDRYYNRATSGLRAYEVRMNGQAVGAIPPGEAIRELPMQLDKEGVYRFTFHGDDGSLLGEANPVWIRNSPEQKIYWGETHGHCGFAEGQGTPEGYFAFARDDAALDFVTLSEHDIWLTDGMWKTLNEVAKDFQREGELIVFPGYEWTSQRQRGGHHNVFFRHPGMERVAVQRAPDLSKLYRALHATHDPNDVLIIPHAHQAGDWRLSDLDLQQLVEVMSSHGTFEWFGQRYLENGYRVGFVGASDDHIGHPGYAAGHPSRVLGGRRSNIFQFGGLAAVWASEKSTDAVFDALRARSTYGTTGSQRIILDARLNGGAMGTSLSPAEDRTIEGRAIGTAPIQRIDLIKNGELLDSVAGTGGETALVEGRHEVVVAFDSSSEVFMRDNPRGHRTWNGSVTVDNGRLLGARLLGTPNWSADALQTDGERASFNVATRGSRRALLLTLADTSSETTLRFEIEQAREVGTAPRQIRAPQLFEAAAFTLPVPISGLAEQVLRVGRYEDRVTVESPPPTRDDIEFRFTDHGEPGDWYYLRVEQVDGHLAWSSPWWVGGEAPR